MTLEEVPDWMIHLDDEDISFIKKFILSSGSLKEIANHYGVTYPTVRLRLDRLIQKIQINEDDFDDNYIVTVKRLALDEKISYEAAKTLVTEYRKTKGGNR